MFDPTLDACLQQWRGVPRYFLALLAALQYRNADFEPMRRLDASEWQDMLSFSDPAHLTLLLAHLPSNVLPGWVASRVQKNVSDNTERVERTKALYVELAQALRSVNAEHLIIKGFTQYPDYIRSLNLRVQSDIDIFCPPNAILSAREALVKIGYEAAAYQKNILMLDHFPPMTRKRGWQWRGNSFDPEMPLAIELHYRLWNEEDTGIRLPEVDQFWYRRVTRDIQGFSFPALDPLDQIAFCCLHILRDMLSGDWIIHRVYELACFLNTHARDETLWGNWQRSHSERLRSLEAISCCLAKTWFGCELPIEVDKQARGLSLPIQQWFHLFCSSPLKGMFAPNHDGVWLHVAVVESTRAKLAAIRNGLLPQRVPPLGIADLNLTRNRHVGRPASPHRAIRYFLYVAARASHYGRIFVRGIWSGVRWWTSQRKLGAAFWTFFAASCLWSLGLSIFFFLFNLFLMDHGFSEKFVGGLTSTLAVGGVVGTLPTGRMAKKFGLRKVLLAGVVSAASILPLRAMFLGRSAQWILAFLAGIALSVWAVCLSPAVAQMTTVRNRAFAFSLIFSSGVGLVALGNLVGGNLAVWLKDIPRLSALIPIDQAALLAACAIAALAIAPVSMLKFPRPVEVTSQSRSTNRFLVRFLFASGLWGLAAGAFNPFATIYFSRHLSVPLPRLGVVFSIAQISQFLGILMAPFLFRKSGRLAGIMYAEAATSIALALLAIVHWPLAASFLYVGFTTAQWMSEPNMYSMLMDNTPAPDRSSAAAWNALVLSLSQGIAAACAGAALVRFGYAAVLSAAAIVALAAAGSFRFLLRPPALNAAHKGMKPATLPSASS